MSSFKSERGDHYDATAFGRLVGLDVLHHRDVLTVCTNLSPEEAVKLSRALVKAAAEALGVSIQEKAATLPDGPL
jgi:hypothetical protein